MKKFLSILLAACLLLGALPMAASAAETVTLVATKTDVKADGVVNYGGYGSLKIEGAYDSNSDGSPVVTKRPQAGLMDKTGNMLFPMRETYSRFYYSDGIVSLTADSSYSTVGDWLYRWDEEWNEKATYPAIYEYPVFYNLDGSEVLSLPSHNEPFEIEAAALRELDTSGYNTSFSAGPMQGGLSAVVKKEYHDWNNQYSVYIIDKTGKTVFDLPEEFEPTNDADAPSGYTYYAKKTVGTFGEGLIAYYEHSWDAVGNAITKVLGYMDSTGKTVIDLSDRGYTNAGPFFDGLAWVNKSDGIGFINKNGEEVIPGNYSSVWSFADGFAAVRDDRGMWGSIDKNGNTVVPFEYSRSFGSGDDGIMTVAKSDDKFGLVDRNNNVILPLEYDDISTFTEGVAYAVKDGYVYVITKQASKPTVGGFNDVFEGDYYADPVVWAVENNITSGVGNGKFAPNSNCTREQIVTFLWRANGSPEPKTTVNPFTDVGQSSYAYKAILWAVENNITSGTGDGKFSPGASCTRDQTVTFLWRSEGSPTAASGSSFTDVKNGDYFADAVAWAVANNITSGVGNNRFNPRGTCTRGQIVTFLYRNK